MKKYPALCLILIFVLCLFGCNDKKIYQLPHDQFCYTTGESQVVEMNTQDRRYIVELLNDAEWVNDLSNCYGDFVFYTQNEEVRYHSECGTFNDYTNKKSTTVSEEERYTINQILGVD